jgi:plasmid stabilization system protein ParE
MRLEFHHQVASDVSQILDYYEGIGEPELAEEFYSALRSFFHKAAQFPEGYATRTRDVRRVNLERFPFHFLYRIVDDRVRVLVVRHHSRRPSLGSRRR